MLTLTQASLIPVLSGSLTYEQVSEATKENKQIYSGREGQAVTMLISIYFPSLEHAFRKVLNSRDKIGQKVLGPAIAKKLPTDRKELQQWFQSEFAVFNQRTDEFKRAICQVGGVKNASLVTSPVQS